MEDSGYTVGTLNAWKLIISTTVKYMTMLNFEGGLEVPGHLILEYYTNLINDIEAIKYPNFAPGFNTAF